MGTACVQHLKSYSGKTLCKRKLSKYQYRTFKKSYYEDFSHQGTVALAEVKSPVKQNREPKDTINQPVRRSQLAPDWMRGPDLRPRALVVS